MKAPITIAIDTLIAEHAAPLLKARGFRKKGQRFVRASGDCIQLVEFDRWKYNEGSQGKFGVTLGVFSPAVWQMVTQARPGWIGDSFDERFPPIQNCLVDESILPPPEDRGLDQYWDVDAERALDEVAGKLIVAMESFALPWFEERAELRALLGDLGEMSRKGVWLSSVYWLCAAALLGDKTAATSALQAVLAPEPSQFFPESEREAFRAIAATA